MKNNELRSKGMTLKPSLMIGKSGLTDKVIEELTDQLERRELVKVKFQRSMGSSSLWKKDLEEKVSEIKAIVVETKGSTALIYKRSSRKGSSYSNSR